MPDCDKENGLQAQGSTSKRLAGLNNMGGLPRLLRQRQNEVGLCCLGRMRSILLQTTETKETLQAVCPVDELCTFRPPPLLKVSLQVRHSLSSMAEETFQERNRSQFRDPAHPGQKS